METGNQLTDVPSKFPDISSCEAFQMNIKTNVKYDGYRFSFGKAHVKGGRFAYGYKTPLLLDENVGELGNVTLPFSTFSDKWDDATGDIIEAIFKNDRQLKRLDTPRQYDIISFVENET